MNRFFLNNLNNYLFSSASFLEGNSYLILLQHHVSLAGIFFNIGNLECFERFLQKQMLVFCSHLLTL